MAKIAKTLKCEMQKYNRKRKKAAQVKSSKCPSCGKKFYPPVRGI